jgi:hypothetical protein
VTLEEIILVEQGIDIYSLECVSLLFSTRMISLLVQYFGDCIIVPQRVCFPPSRLETRTKESNLYASTRVVNPRAK